MYYKVKQKQRQIYTEIGPPLLLKQDKCARAVSCNAESQQRSAKGSNFKENEVITVLNDAHPTLKYTCPCIILFLEQMFIVYCRCQIGARSLRMAHRQPGSGSHSGTSHLS